MKQTYIVAKAVLTLLLAVCAFSFARNHGPSQLTARTRASGEREFSPRTTELQSVKPLRELSALSVSRRSMRPSTAALSGEIRIGAGKDYPSINAAMTDLNMNGVEGPVVFLLSDPSYTEAGLLILSVIGGSSTNTVTLKPDSNVTSAVIALTDNSDYGGGIVLAAVSYFTIDGTRKNGVPGSRDLTIQFDPHQAFPGNSFDAPVRIRDGCSNLTLQNCRIFSQYDGSLTSALPAVSVTTTTDPNNYVTIQNNLMSRASFGIRTVGGMSFDVGLKILYNQIGGAFLSDAGDQTDSIQICGIYYEYTDSAVVSHNQVKGVRRNSSATDGQDAGLRTSGIWQNYGVNSTVSYNVVDEVRSAFPTSSTSTNTRMYGIRIVGLTQNLGGPYPHTNNLAYNNAVSDIYGTGATAFRDFCFSAENAQGDFIYYNSMSLTGSSDGGAVVIQLTGDNSSSGDFTVTDNAFENSRAGNAINCIYRIFDNSGNPDLSHGNHNVLYSPVTLSIDANGSTWPSWIDAYATHPDSASSPHDPHFASTSNLHIDSSAASSAMNLAVRITGINDDIDGQLRSSTAPDAGSDEVVGTSTLNKDVMPVAFVSPTGAGFPKGLPVSSVTARFRNNTLVPASYVAEVRIYDPTGVEISGSPFSTSVPAHPAMSFLNVTIPVTFTPATDGFYGFKAISDMAGDLFPANDTASASFLSVPLIALGTGYLTSFETDSEQLGWFGDNDFQLANFTKLGGPHSGTHAWVTNPGPPGTPYTQGGVVSHVYSPFFDLTGITTAYLAFYQSIQTEPNWDRSLMQYSIDSGKTWKQLGILNDPNGINWYDTRVYQNAAGDTVNCFDILSANRVGFPVGAPGWTSNGDCSGSDLPSGPNGYVYNEIKLPATIAGKTYVRFRYAAFSDAVTAFDGWAFDDFCIKLTGAVANASVQGRVFLDKNGNGIFEPGSGETPTQGVVVRLAGAIDVLDTSDVNGNYSFTGLRPGLYEIREDTLPVGTVVTTSAQGEYPAVSIGPGDALTGLNFGDFRSYIGGRVFSDLNDNGAYDAEPGLGGWTVELRNAADSTLVKSIATDVSGSYFFSIPPGTYLVDEVITAGWRRTLPSGGSYAGLHVDTISGAANITARDFGNFEYGSLRVELTMDLNGNGVQDEADIIQLPYGITGTFTLTRNGVPFRTTKVGNAESASSFDSLDEGIYRIEETGIPPGWIMTAGGVRGTFTRIINSGSIKDTARYLNFALNTINGQVFNDLNGNGVKDPTEPGLAGWIVKLSGASNATAVTDSLGRYSFTNVGPGSYIVAESLQTGWRRTLPAGSGTYTINAVGAIQIAIHNNNNFGNKVTVSGVDDGELIPKQFSLQQGYPNPFNPTVTIGFALPEDAFVTLKVYNLLGQEIATLTDHERINAGVHQVQFNAGQSPSGIYFYRITAFDPEHGALKYQDVRKIVLLK